MRRFAIVAVAATAAAGCAAVKTHVTLLDPSHAARPASQAVILLERPGRAHTTLALIEARGAPGGTEGELLEAARRDASRIGADAVVRLSVDRETLPPVEVYDPVFSPYYSRYALRAGGYAYPPFIYPPYMGEYRLIGGGTVLILKAAAIRYDRDLKEK